MSRYSRPVAVKAAELIEFLNKNPATLALVQVKGPQDRDQLKHRHKAIKKKGGKAPVDYHAVELKASLEEALATKDTKEVAGLYYSLKHLLNY